MRTFLYIQNFKKVIFQTNFHRIFRVVELMLRVLSLVWRFFVLQIEKSQGSIFCQIREYELQPYFTPVCIAQCSKCLIRRNNFTPQGEIFPWLSKISKTKHFQICNKKQCFEKSIIIYFLNWPHCVWYNASVFSLAEKFISRLGGLINVMIRALLALVG